VEIGGKTHTLHSLVAAAYLPADNGNDIIIHKRDGDKTNNRASNLKRVS
jgi:hypothetical protein